MDDELAVGVALGSDYVEAGTVACRWADSWAYNCTVCPSWSNVYRASPPRTSDAVQHRPRKLEIPGYVVRLKASIGDRPCCVRDCGA